MNVYNYVTVYYNYMHNLAQCCLGEGCTEREGFDAFDWFVC